MKFFLAWSFLLIIWINSLLLFNDLGWWLLAIILLLASFFYRTLFFPWEWKKVIFTLISLIIIVSHSQFFIKPQQAKAANHLLEKKLLKGEVIKKTLAFYQLSLTDHKKVLISKNYFWQGNQQQLNLEIGDQISFCWQKKRFFFSNTGSFWKEKKKTLFLTIDQKQCQLKKKKKITLYRKINHYLTTIHNKETKKWIDWLLFQNLTAPILPWREKVATMGILHLFVVSGWHLLIISKIWHNFSDQSKKNYQKRSWELTGLIFCWLAIYLTNWKLTSVKSGLFLTWIWLEKLTKTQSVPVYERIAYLGLIFLMIQPSLFKEIDFQLSFLASWIVFNQTKKRRVNWWEKISQQTKLHQQILLAILPILILINSQINLLSGFYNLGFALIMTFIYPLLLVTIWIPGSDLIWKIIFAGQEKLINLSYHYVWVINFGQWSLTSITIYYLMVIILTKLERKQWSKIFLLFLGGLGLVLLTHVNWRQKFYHLHFLNVGHGLSIFLQGPNKKLNLLFDAGIGKAKITNKPTIYNYLKKQAVTNLDALFISHQDNDHKNNLAFLQSKLTIKKIYSNHHPQPFYQFPGLKINNLNWKMTTSKKENNRGLVLAFSLAHYKILFTFDLEISQEKKLLQANRFHLVDILQVGHHGAKNATSEAFLKVIKPKFCLLSSNQLRISTAEKLRAKNCQVFNTFTNHHLNFQLGKKITITKW